MPRTGAVIRPENRSKVPAAVSHSNLAMVAVTAFPLAETMLSPGQANVMVAADSNLLTKGIWTMMTTASTMRYGAKARNTSVRLSAVAVRAAAPPADDGTTCAGSAAELLRTGMLAVARLACTLKLPPPGPAAAVCGAETPTRQRRRKPTVTAVETRALQMSTSSTGSR